jgi:endogenous inhibitor of DNA gyrase (YacG/DUF329 family)
MQARCPICGKTFEADPAALPPGFPFCSERCKLIDLGRWIDGSYSIPGAPADRSPGTRPDPDPDAPGEGAEDSGACS